MLANGLTIYESWDLKKISIPSRSKLFQLEPIGVGTPNVESLTSFITRLAEAHCVFPGVLMERVIAPLLEKKYSSAQLHKIYNFTGALNGKGVMATDILETLERLTYCSNLECLTLLNLSELIPNWHLMRRHRAWCPRCYELWRSSNILVYDCLLWTLKPVKFCPVHSVPLLEQCPHCNGFNLPLSWKTQPGFCAKCGSWLGNSADCQPMDGDRELEWHLWRAGNLGQLLSVSSSLKLFPYRYRVAASLKIYADIMTSGNLAALARYLQVPKNTFWLWCRGKNQPSLEALLRICYCLKVSIVDFLRQDPLKINAGGKVAPALPFGLKSRAQSQQFNTDAIRRALEEAIANNETPPPSMEEVARRLRCDRRTIYRHFSDLCRQISARYTQYRRHSYLEAVRDCCQEVRQAALEIYNRGEYPTEALVCQVVSKPGYLRYKRVRQALKDVQQKLRVNI